ncbi:hypothetical protein TRICI_006127 [Trichomonascus ciferrii]|uniref:Indoleamine 2,3-dioxygenase n=1 Tax=Trichomonascus ciferrii TaxID=44093 RepID=A0A642UKS7_9ASCO|nr:hypothetical protein TRICI_006127 [Trichomonascus ciferrii]
MRHPIPRLEDYDVSAKTGFLPEQAPLERLSDPYFKVWEDLVVGLPSLIMTRKLRPLVDQMPILGTDKLGDDIRQWQRACVVLGFLSHGYVWAGENPSDHLPRQLSDPWVAVCDKLELPAIVSYAGVCLWNFKPIISSADWELDNLATLNTFTGCLDESWFYLVSTAIERQGAPALATGLEAIQACRDNDSEKVVSCLQTLAEAIDAITNSLGRMHEMCDPHIFYFRIRPFLAGWKNMADAGLPHGVRYGDEKEYRQISGGSNAQSSLIQALDILLDVEHHPTGERPTDQTKKDEEGLRAKKNHNFIHEMRKYMPGPHRRFLEELDKVAEIRDYVVRESKNTPALALSYDACLAVLRAFRDKHIQIVSRFIVLQARQSQKSSATKRDGLASQNSGGGGRGTGGTALIPFLKQARDETGDPAASSWGRRLLSSHTGSNNYSRRKRKDSFDHSDDNKKPKMTLNVEADSDTSDSGSSQVGLSGKWDIYHDAKDIAHW